MIKITSIFTLLFLSFIHFSIAQVPGDIIWHNDYGGDGNEAFTDVKQTADGGYIAVGYTDSYGTGDDVKHLWAVKTDVMGETEWTTVLGEGLSFGDWANRVVITPTGEFVIVGETYSYAAAEKDVWLVKLDMNGNIVWSKTWDGAGSYDTGSSIIINNAGEYIVTGYSFDSSGNRDALLIAFDELGDYLWHNVYGGIDEEWTTSLQQTSDNGYILSGYTKSYDATGRDLYLLKTDQSGVEQWHKVHGGANDQWGRKIITLENGEYMIAGWQGIFVSASDIWILRTDTNGDITWSQTYDYGDFDTANGIITTNDGGFLISGLANDQFLAMKISFDGTVEWMEDSFDGAAVSAFQDADEDYVVAGSHQPSFFVVDATLLKLKGTDTIDVEDLISNTNEMDVHLYPNPFDQETTLSFTLNKSSSILIEINDIQGKLIKTLVNNYYELGKHEVIWDRTNSMGTIVPNASIYIYTIQSSDHIRSGKIIIE